MTNLGRWLARMVAGRVENRPAFIYFGPVSTTATPLTTRGVRGPQPPRTETIFRLTNTQQACVEIVFHNGIGDPVVWPEVVWHNTNPGVVEILQRHDKPLQAIVGRAGNLGRAQITVEMMKNESIYRKVFDVEVY